MRKFFWAIKTPSDKLVYGSKNGSGILLFKTKKDAAAECFPSSERPVRVVVKEVE